MYWIVAYDVRCDRRRARVAKQCQRAGLRVQKSVFLVVAPRPGVRKLLEKLSKIIEPTTDHVAFWPLRESWAAEWLETGQPTGPVEQNVIVW